MKYYEIRFSRDSDVDDHELPCYVFWIYAESIYAAVDMAYDLLSQEVGLTHDFALSAKEVFFNENLRGSR